MVGGHDQSGLCPPGRLDDPAEGPVHGPDGLEHGPFVLDVPDDIHVGQVGEDEHLAVTGKGQLDGRRDAGRAHVRDLGVVRDLRRRNDNPFLAGKDIFVLAVEEVADMDGLFGLRDLDHPEPCGAEDLGQRVLEVILRRESDLDVEGLGVFDERDIMEIELLCREMGETRVGQALRELDLPLAADVVEDKGIPFRDLSDRPAGSCPP